MFWKKHPKKFFSGEEQERIIGEIRKAEDRTSGEIRVHLDCCSREIPLQKAKQVFHRLGMTRTKHRNGILIYLATEDRKFAILGDEGIHRVVPENYWEKVKEKMQKQFREGRISEGICLGIQEIGEKLKTYFPVEKDDRNELPDSISEEK